MTLFFYNLALIAILLLGAPWWLFRLATTQKYREALLGRLGKLPAHLRALRSNPSPTNSSAKLRSTIWMHAVSVGEVLAISRLVEELDRTLPEFQLLISTTTRTGQQLARERFGSHRVFYCPLDLPWAVGAYLNGLRPRLFILAETEFWPNLLSGCFRRGIPVAVVNARISDRSWPRYHRLRRLWSPFLGKLRRVLAQSPIDAERLTALGCREDRVAVAGNLKFDVRAAAETDATRLLRSITAGLKLLVAGSTLEGEEAALVDSWPRMLEADSQLILILAPRHPERFDAVAKLLDRSGFAWVKRSAWRPQATDLPAPLKGGEIILLDTIGELASIYSLATIAFVGGSLIPAGGHNPLEPAQFGVPIMMGPHDANFRAIADDLRAHDAICIATTEDLAETLIGLLGNSAAAGAMGQRGREVFERQAGATSRCVAAIHELLEAPSDAQSAVELSR